MSEFTILGAVILSVYVVLGFVKPKLAFTTAPVAAIVLGYIGLESNIEEFVVVAPALFVGTLMAVAASGVRRESRQWVHWWAGSILLTMAALLLLGLGLTGFSALGVGFVIPLLFVLAIMAIIGSLANYGLASRRVTAMTVFSTLGASMRQNLPLPMALDCAAAGQADTAAFTLRKIQSWLVKGYPLTEAIRRGYPQCPPRVLALLAAGARVDQLPAAVAAVEADMKSNTMEQGRLRPVHPFYPVVVLVIAFLLVLFIMTFVMPQFKAVLGEMFEGRRGLPAATRVLLGIMSVLVYDAGWRAALGLLLLVLAGPPLYRLARRRRPEKPYLRSWIVDSLKWHLPVVRWFEKNRALGQVVEVLRLSLHAGCPVNEAIRSTLQLDVNLLFRTRLACWLRRVERGEEIGGSARRCGLGSALAWAFDGGAETGNTPAVLELLESYYRSNYSYRVNLTRFILWPCGIILLGATVGFIVYAVFSPGVLVIRQLTESVYP
jgi:type II secretory pathway component PulF